LKEPPNLESARGLVGDLTFDEMDTVCLLATCILRREPPHAPRHPYLILDATYPRPSLYELWYRLEFWMRQEDPRAAVLTEDGFWTVVANVARVRNTSPLVAIGGSELDSFLVSMASRLHDFRTRKPGSPSSEISTPAP
jgi:hypothetical protein